MNTGVAIGCIILGVLTGGMVLLFLARSVIDYCKKRKDAKK